MRKMWLFGVAGACAIGVVRGVAQTGGAVSIPQPTFHHIHLNSVNPDRSIAWYTNYWPTGRRTTLADMPAFVDEKGFYLLYTKVARQAPGGFDRKAQRSVPQSAFWTFGSTFGGPDTSAFLARVSKLDPKAFELVTLYGGPEGKQTATHALALPLGDQLATATTIKEQQAQREKLGKPAPTSGLDFGYVVDPDGMLVEVTAGKADGFREHTHFWGENPLCSANWHVEHLGATFPATQNTFSTAFTFANGRWNPCAVPTGEITFPTYMSVGQLRIPAGNARIADASWLWYPRQCRNGRCGAGNDQPLAKSRGQVVDHIGLSYPNLDPVLAHLRAAKIPILEGPYKFGDTRAVLIEDLDGLAFELIERRK
ncbi:MAG: VOC family protein [Acidimicrobiia bacterium]|nr:VOC family protein [Acidimicrobiia bacterium]